MLFFCLFVCCFYYNYYYFMSFRVNVRMDLIVSKHSNFFFCSVDQL